LPGAAVGLIVGFATFKYGGTSGTYQSKLQ
jgi:hypothetical protein